MPPTEGAMSEHLQSNNMKLTQYTNLTDSLGLKAYETALTLLNRETELYNPTMTLATCQAFFSQRL